MMEASDDDDGVDFVDVHVGGVNEGDGVGNGFVNGAIGHQLEQADRQAGGRQPRRRGPPARFGIDDYVY